MRKGNPEAVPVEDGKLIKDLIENAKKDPLSSKITDTIEKILSHTK